MAVPKRTPHSLPSLSRQESIKLTAVLRSGHIVQGPKVEAFERQFARWHGLKHAVALNSGTSALHLSLLALGVKANHEVLLPTFTCTALLNSIKYVGAKPVLVDINEDDLNISVDDAKRKLTRRTKAIIVPHMFGMPADIKRLCRLGVPVIEDCAQAIGSKVQGKKVGTFGAISIFSFYATKMLTTGEGGMILTKNPKWAKAVRDLREYDKRKDYVVRYNYKMADIQAVLGIEQLKKLNGFIKKRRSIAKSYDAVLPKDVRPAKITGRSSVYYRYLVKTNKPAKLVRALNKAGVDANSPVYPNLHSFVKGGRFPVANQITKQLVSIPIYPPLSLNSAKRIAQIVLATT